MNTWDYPLQTDDVNDMVAVGMDYGDVLEYPSTTYSMADGLQTLGQLTMPHDRGLIVTSVGPMRWRVVSHSHYPAAFELGMLYSCARRFKPTGYTLVVYQDELAVAQSFCDVTTFVVELV